MPIASDDVYGGQTTIGSCLLEALSFLSFSSFDEIGNGAVIEVLKTTRCGYVTRVIAIGAPSAQ